jgi:endonuclease/exonuclease/phosphatase family metal-dependent hydrolase
MNKEKKKRKPWQSVLIWIARAVTVIVICFAMLLVFLTVTEYRPADQEQLEVVSSGDNNKELKFNTSLKLMTWNVGYGALGDNADFFMDGGKSVNTADEARVKENLTGIADEVKTVDPDVLFLQEVDLNSSRSHDINEEEAIQSMLQGSSASQLSNSTFAYNFKVSFIPYPLPPIGKVNSGIVTFSSYAIEESTRYQLPCPFSWPVRLANLKRCVMVDRIPIMNEDGSASGKYLVLANLHLEAYDDGEGKKAQTEMLREILQKEADEGNYVIAGGDFNQTFSSIDDSMYPEYEGTWQCGEIDESEFSSDWQFRMDNSVPTCRSLDKAYANADQTDFQYYMIDGYIVSKNIDVSSIKTQSKAFQNTDHNPVVMEVKLGND